MKKWDSTKCEWDTRVPGHANWTISSLLSQFCPRIFPTFNFYTGGSHFSLPQRVENGIHPKVNETQGFQCQGHSNWTICFLLSLFCRNFFPTFNSYIGGHIFVGDALNGEIGLSLKDRIINFFLLFYDRTVLYAQDCPFIKSLTLY